MLNKAQKQTGFLEIIAFADEATDVTPRTAHRRHLHKWCAIKTHTREQNTLQAVSESSGLVCSVNRLLDPSSSLAIRICTIIL